MPPRDDDHDGDGDVVVDDDNYDNVNDFADDNVDELQMLLLHDAALHVTRHYRERCRILTRGVSSHRLGVNIHKKEVTWGFK